tara:strand:+ start:2193 stop:2684 length:492 start_codon:yes stop_codon:yes gene_type:complete
MHNKKNNINKSRNFIQGLRPLSSALPHGLKKIIKKSGYNLSNVVDNWSKIVGKDISNSCYPNSIKIGKELSNGILVINVIHGKELDIEYSKKEIIDKINSFYGYNYIKEIKLKIVHEKSHSIDKIKKTNLNTIQTNLKLKNVKNEKLKHSLNKLIKAYNSKNV